MKMGVRRLRFDARKNHERRKYGRAKATASHKQQQHGTTVSLPTSVIKASIVSSISSVLHRMLLLFRALPSGWICSQFSNSLALYQLDLAPSTMSAVTSIMLTITSDFSWSLRIGQREVEIGECILISCVLWQLLNSVNKVVSLLTTLTNSKFCIGNPDEKYSNLVDRHKGVFRNQSGAEVVAYHDTDNFPHPTVRHIKCGLIVSRGSGDRCQRCKDYRKTLSALYGRAQRRASAVPSSKSQTNFRLRDKLDKITAKEGVVLDDEISDDLHKIMIEEGKKVKDNYPEDSFKALF